MTNFDDIRPYNDDEAIAAIQRIISSDECLNLIGVLKFPRLFSLCPWLLRPILRLSLQNKAKVIHSVDDFQDIVAGYLNKMLAKTTDGLTIRGFEHVGSDKPCLFLSNHRDIALDPAVTNYALYNNGAKTVRIAIGDNLLSKPFASDLMRANKSFIVKRSLSGPRELLKSLKTLSAYIWHSLKEDGENIWIAHREGRAKDGLDKTEPAVIKMLTIAKPKDMAFSDYINQLRIVPVSISYEYDPCDAMKAAELRKIELTGSYTKSEHEDMDSIGKGVVGSKGHIYVHFGECLQGSYENADAVALAMDKAIAQNYQIQPTNVLAYELLYGKDKLASAFAMPGLFSDQEANYTEQDREKFHQRIADIPDDDTVCALNIYANPIVNRINVCGHD